jgi:hypothetical protein
MGLLQLEHMGTLTSMARRNWPLWLGALPWLLGAVAFVAGVPSGGSSETGEPPNAREVWVGLSAIASLLSSVLALLTILCSGILRSFTVRHLVGLLSCLAFLMAPFLLFGSGLTRALCGFILLSWALVYACAHWPKEKP